MEKKKKKFKLLDLNRDGKGVNPYEDRRPTLSFFFKQLGRKFWKIFSLNLLMLLQIVPIILIIYFYMTGPTTPTLDDTLYIPLLGAQTAAPTGVGATLMNTAFSMFNIPSFNTYVYWLIGALLVFLVTTYGLQKVGAIYILRNMVRGDAVFIFSDFFYAIKRNWKQGIIMGVIDCVAMFLLGFDFIYLSSQPTNAFTNFMYVATVAIIIIYALMRFYTYLMLVTFDMKLIKIFKNALIFTALGIKRNIMAVLGIIVLVAISAALIILGLQVGLYVTLLLPFLYLLGIMGFMYTYAAYPVIEKYMIDPQPSSNN